MADTRVSSSLKLVASRTPLYLVLPLDLVADLLAGLGHLDYLAIIRLGFVLHLQLCPRPIIQEHLRQTDSATTHHPGGAGRPPPADTYIEPPFRTMEGDELGQR